MFVTHKLTPAEREVLDAGLRAVIGSTTRPGPRATAQRLLGELTDGGGCPVPRRVTNALVQAGNAAAVQQRAERRLGIVSDAGADTYVERG